MKLRILSLLLLSSVLAWCQSTQPQYILGFGGGWDHYNTPRAVGWGGAAVRITENVYSWSTLAMKSNGARLLTGLAPQVWDQGNVKIFFTGQIGLETTATGNQNSPNAGGTTQAAYAVGGAVDWSVGKYFKVPSIGLIGIVGITKPSDNSDPAVVKPVFGIGIAWHSLPKQ